MTQDGPIFILTRQFQVLDSREPRDWVTDYGDDGERYAYPAPLNNPGFFEDFFDNQPKAVKTFWHASERASREGWPGRVEPPQRCSFAA